MQKLIVRNFGPIKELDLDVKDLMLFIGEQATGKSTVAKLVYFFKEIVKKELISYLFKPLPKITERQDAPWQLNMEFRENIGWRLNDLFFESNHAPFHFCLDYQYKPDLWLRVENSGQTPPPRSEFTDEYYEINPAVGISKAGDRLRPIFEKIVEHQKKYLSREAALTAGRRTIEAERKANVEEIEKNVSEFLGDNEKVIYIPAGRSVFAVLSERLPSKGWDLLMEDFPEKISTIKPAFGHSLSEIVEQKNIRGNHKPTKSTLDLSNQKIRGILKGEYRVDEEGEKIFIDDLHYVKLSHASSGQQEVLWILLHLFVLLLNREKVFLIIEEPEAHLFPKAQKSLVELITLLFNENNSQVLITTHSPYILTAFNNLIYAGNVGREHDEADGIISKLLWIDHKKAGAYRLHDGIAEDLMDEETHLMRVEEIDTVSQSINQDFDTLLNLELQ